MPTLPLTLQTRLGRRIGGLFVIGALLPVVVLAVLGYRQVRAELLREADAQLRQAAKSVGMGLLDQLQRARELAGQLAADHRAGDGTSAAADLQARATAAFEPPAAGAPVFWSVPPGMQLDAGAAAALDSGRTALRPAGGDSAGVWLVIGSPAHRPLWSRLRTDYLFEGARERAVVGSGDAGICVRWAETAAPIRCDQDPENETMVSASWNVFLAYEFDAGSWQVEVRRPLSAVLAPIGAFRRTFFASLVAVLGLVVLLTTVQVRRSLQPLEALREGTARLAKRDFSGSVVVRPGDEFADLAGSFNQMAGDLDQQFRSNAQLIARLNDLTYGALAALARAVDASSHWTAGHSERVTAFALRMAARAGADPDQLDTVRRGGLLHDIGKIGISPLILDKPGQLEPAELQRIREHPALGSRILAPVSAFAEAIPIVRHHHEWWNGEGYPDGLRGEAIPRLARLLAVADVYDALVSDRPYRKGWKLTHALEVIERAAGTQFDPDMVQLFLAVWHEEGDQARFGPTIEVAG